jgi:hypothetical protein
MKNINKYLTTLFAVVVFAGCSDDIIYLEPKNQLLFSTTLTSLEGLEGAIYGVYERGRFVYSENDYCLYKTFYTDLVKAGTNIVDQATWNQMATFTNFNAQNTGVLAIWNGYYVGLSRANAIITNIDNAEPGERRNTVLGEACYFRAYFHLNLVQYWDNIVLANKEFSDPEEKVTLAPKSDVYDLIVSDLEQAINLLPEANVVTSKGRVSKGVARHLLSLAYMDIGNWSGAAEMAVQVINDPAYSFAPLNEIFSTHHQENSEIIFSWQFSKDEFDNLAGGVQRTSMQLAPLYDRVNGVRRSFAQGGRPWSRMSPTEYYWTLFEEKDLRLNAWHKRYWIYDIDSAGVDELPAGVSIGDTVTPENMTETSGLGPIVIEPTTMKYWEDGALLRTIDEAQGYRNIIQYRLSQAYLTAAEAYMRAGNAAAGQPYLDAVRTRAGVDPIELNEQNILDENARELGHEGHRYAMLKRLGILMSSIQAHSPAIGANMLPHHVRWPIPKEYVDLTKVPQNEGYE